MDDVWDNSTRFAAINLALSSVPHDQIALGLGFRLTHNPSSCRRCRANIASLELASLVRMLESREEVVSEGVEILDT